MVPLRSCSRKLNPAAAPKPANVGMLKGKTTASGIAANLLLQRRHDAPYLLFWIFTLFPRL